MLKMALLVLDKQIVRDTQKRWSNGFSILLILCWAAKASGPGAHQMAPRTRSAVSQKRVRAHSFGDTVVGTGKRRRKQAELALELYVPWEPVAQLADCLGVAIPTMMLGKSKESTQVALKILRRALSKPVQLNSN